MNGQPPGFQPPSWPPAPPVTTVRVGQQGPYASPNVVVEVHSGQAYPPAWPHPPQPTVQPIGYGPSPWPSQPLGQQPSFQPPGVQHQHPMHPTVQHMSLQQVPPQHLTMPRDPIVVLRSLRLMAGLAAISSALFYALIAPAPIFLVAAVAATLAFIAAPMIAKQSARQLAAWTERGILHIAPRFGGKLAAVDVARELGVSLNDAEKALVRLSANGFAAVEIAETTGAAIYTLQQASLPASAPSAPPRALS